MFLFILMVWIKTVHAFPGIVLDCSNSTSVKYTSNCIGGQIFHCLPMENRSLVIFCANPEIQGDKVCPFAFFGEEGKWEIKYNECMGSEEDCPGKTNKLSSTEPQKFEGCKLFPTRKPRTTQNSLSENSTITSMDMSSTIVNDYTTNITNMVYHVSLQNSIIIIISGIIGFIVICIISFISYRIVVVRCRRQYMPKETMTVETRHSSNSHDYSSGRCFACIDSVDM